MSYTPRNYRGGRKGMFMIWWDVGYLKPNDGRGLFYQRPSRHGAGRFSALDQAAKSRAVLEYASFLYHHGYSDNRSTA